jgi:integrase
VTARYRAFRALLAGTGLRVGEVLGLAWTRTDLLTILAIRTLGIILSTSGALRLLRNRDKREIS